MKRILYFAITFILSLSTFSAQEGMKKFLYKGTIDKFPVTFYIQEDTSGCGPKFYHGMYKYDNVSKWLFLEISDDEETRLVMVENGITGILSLKKTGNSLNGFWLSPDGKKKLNVNLKEFPTNTQTMQSYDKKYDDVNYETNDC